MASTQRRVPLEGAEILRRYERSRASNQRPKSEPLEQISPSTSEALRSRAEFAGKVRGRKSKDLEDVGKIRKKDSVGSTKSQQTNGSGPGAMTDASSVAIDSDIRNTTKSHSGGGHDGNGSDSSDDGWDDNFGDGSGNNGNDDHCNNCNDNHWCDDHWYGGHHDHWGWWPNWGWHGGWSMSYGSWCGWYGWYGWWRHPMYYRYYGYNPWWGDSYYTPTVVTSTIYTTEVVEIPIVQEVPVAEAPIVGVEPGSPDVVQSALYRAAVEYLSLGDRAFAEQRYGDAVRHYARAIECSPEDPILQLVLSDALFATGDYHYAAHCLRRALELEPDLLEVEFDKRSFYGDPSDFDHHILLLEGYLADHVLDDDARLLLGANYLFGGDPDALVALFSDTFGDAVRDSDTGRLLLAAAHRAITAR